MYGSMAEKQLQSNFVGVVPALQAALNPALAFPPYQGSSSAAPRVPFVAVSSVSWGSLLPDFVQIPNHLPGPTVNFI